MLSYCDHRKFNLTGGFFIFLVMVFGRRIISICSAGNSCYIWAGALIGHLGILNKLQKRVFRIVGSSLDVFVELLAHCRNVASLNPFYRYYFGTYLSEVADLPLLPYSCVWSTFYSNRFLMIFLSLLVDFVRMSRSTFSFLGELDLEILCLQNAFFWPMV